MTRNRLIKSSDVVRLNDDGSVEVRSNFRTTSVKPKDLYKKINGVHVNAFYDPEAFRNWGDISLKISVIGSNVNFRLTPETAREFANFLNEIASEME